MTASECIDNQLTEGGATEFAPKSQPDADYEPRMEGHISGLQQFLGIVTQPDNIPIMAMMILVLFFTYLAFKQARRNDQLIERGERDKIIEEMRK